MKEQLKDLLRETNKKILPRRERKKFLNEIAKTIQPLCSQNKNVYSVFTAGSLSRGDFIPGVSDFDLMVVFREERDESDFLRILEKECKKKFRKHFQDTSHQEWTYDIQHEFLPKIPTKSNPSPKQKTQRGQFGFRAFDTARNGKTLYGENILKNLFVTTPKTLTQERIKKLLAKYHQKDDDIWRVMHIGDIIKAAQIHFGLSTYDKREGLKGFVNFVPDFPTKNFIFKFWEEYLDNSFFKKNNQKIFMEEAKTFLSQLVKTVQEN